MKKQNGDAHKAMAHSSTNSTANRRHCKEHGIHIGEPPLGLGSSISIGPRSLENRLLDRAVAPVLARPVTGFVLIRATMVGELLQYSVLPQEVLRVFIFLRQFPQDFL